METKKIGFVTNIEKDPTLQETKKMVDFVLKKVAKYMFQKILVMFILM